MRAAWAFSVAMVLLLAGCGRQAQRNDKADVEKAIQQYIAAKPGLSTSGMAMEIKQVNLQGDKAEAEVLFRAKSNPDFSMAMRYALKRTGSNTWAVESGKSSGVATPPGTAGSGSPHAMPGSEGAASPHGMPGSEGAASPHRTPSAAPAHPPAGSAANTAPEGKTKR